MNPSEATRLVFWNVTQVWVMYVLFGAAAMVALYGVYRRVQSWRRGRPALRFDRPAKRLGLVLKDALGHGRTLRRGYAGTFHFMLFGGLLVLTVATLIVMVHEDLGFEIMKGRFYLYFQSLAVDLFGLLVLVGIVVLWLRRSVERPRELVRSAEAGLILSALFVITVTGFLLEGWRIAVTDDPWGAFSPVGYALAGLFKALLPVPVMRLAHAGCWWFHLVLVFAFLAWAPYTKMAHVLFSPLNVFTANLDGYAKSLREVDFEGDQTLGAHTLEDFTWKDLLDLDSCTECGRCDAACPAHGVGKSLSPRDIILDLRRLLHLSPVGDGGTDKAGLSVLNCETALAPVSLWQCTTCAACMEACPVHIEQMPKIVDLRRYLVMEEADFPPTLQEALTCLEERGHPFHGTSFSRLDWAQGLDAPVLSEMDDPAQAEILLWPGCGGALVERNQSVTRSLARLLDAAGMRWAILGREESCTGDPARRVGNEYLFEDLAKRVIATLDRYHVRKIVAPCPHCFSSLRNDYPRLGGHYEVLHHSELLSQLAAQGRLPVTTGKGEAITFHDPCYLGRHNGQFEAPRELIDLTSPSRRLEMEQSREQSFCCGGGGGMCFVDEPPGQRVNVERARQVLETGAEVVAVGCPFCMTMLEDGLAAHEEGKNVRVRDVAELLWEARK